MSTKQVVITYRVGETMPPEWKSPDADRVEWNYRAGHHMLIMTYYGIRADELTDFQIGRCEFAFFTEDQIIFFLTRIGSIPWSDNSYTWHLLSKEEQAFGPPPESKDENERTLINIIVIEGLTRKIVALRQVFISHKMTKLLHEAIRQQAASAWAGPEEHEQTIRRVYQQFPTPEKLLARAIARCVGEDKRTT